MHTITRREAVIVARRMRHQGYTNRVRTADLQGQTISDAAIHVAGASGDPRNVAETIIGIMKFSCRQF